MDPSDSAPSWRHALQGKVTAEFTCLSNHTGMDFIEIIILYY